MPEVKITSKQEDITSFSKTIDDIREGSDRYFSRIDAIRSEWGGFHVFKVKNESTIASLSSNTNYFGNIKRFIFIFTSPGDSSMLNYVFSIMHTSSVYRHRIPYNLGEIFRECTKKGFVYYRSNDENGFFAGTNKSHKDTLLDTEKYYASFVDAVVSDITAILDKDAPRISIILNENRTVEMNIYRELITAYRVRKDRELFNESMRKDMIGMINRRNDRCLSLIQKLISLHFKEINFLVNSESILPYEIADVAPKVQKVSYAGSRSPSLEDLFE